MSVPVCRSCCAKTGRTVLINKLTKCSDTGQSSRKFAKNVSCMCRDEWNFIQNFGHEMYKNYLLMQSLKKHTTCPSRLVECLQPKNVEKFVKEKTNVKTIKKGSPKVLPSIPFIHNFDFLNKLNYVVGADAGADPLSTSKKAQAHRAFKESRGLKCAEKLRPASNFPKVATAASQPTHTFSDSIEPVNAVSQALAQLPDVGGEHVNWFGHDIGYKIVPKTGAVELDFGTSPTAALAEQRYETFEPSSVFRLPKDGVRSKTFSKTKVRRDGKQKALPCTERQKRTLRHFDLVCVKGFQTNRDNFNLAPDAMSGFGLPMHTVGALNGLGYVREAAYLPHIAVPRQCNGLVPTKYLAYAGVSDKIQIPRAIVDLRSREGFQYNPFDEAGGIPRDLGPFLDTHNLKQTVGLSSGKPGFPQQGKIPITAACLGNMEAYRYLTRIGGFSQANLKRTVNGLGCIGEQPTKVRPLGGLRSTKPSHYVPFVEMSRPAIHCGFGNMEAYKYLRHFGGPLHGHLTAAARDLKRFEDVNYLGRAGSTRQGGVMGPAGWNYVDTFGYLNPAHIIGDAGPDTYWELEQSKVPKYFGFTPAPENVTGAAADSGYIGNSGYLRQNSVSRHGKTDFFARYSDQAGVARQAGVVSNTSGRGRADASKYFVVYRPSINARQSIVSRRPTGLMIREAPRLMRHIVIPRREDSSGIEADLAYIREGRLFKHYKVARTFGSLPTNVHEAMKHLRRPLVSSQRNRFGPFAGFEYGDPRLKYFTSRRQGTKNELRYAEAIKNMRRFRAPGYESHPGIHPRGPFDYTKFRSTEGQIPENFQASRFRRGIGHRLKRRSTHPRKTLNQEEVNFDPQRWAGFFAAEPGYVYDPGYTGHSYPLISAFFGNNYGLQDLDQHSIAMPSLEEQRQRERARLHSLNLFYSIINQPDMEMEAAVPEEFSIPNDYHTELKAGEKIGKKENELSLLHVAKLLKDHRKKTFHPVAFHEPYDKERPWTWIQNFPKNIPNEILKRLSPKSLQTLRAWQRYQALLVEKYGDRSSPKTKHDKKRRHGNK